MKEFDSLKDILNTTGTYTGLTMGTSMLPLIHHQRDNIIVVKNKGRLKKYDVPVYVLPSGKYVMHRILKVCDDHYVIAGDNLLRKEYVTDDMICGVLVGFYKDGKRYIDCEKSVLYKIYSKIWADLFPIRPVLLFVPRCIGWAKRHIFKRGDK